MGKVELERERRRRREGGEERESEINDKPDIPF